MIRPSSKRSRIFHQRLFPFLLGAVLFFTPLFCSAQTDTQPDGDVPDPVAVFNEAQDLQEKGDLAGAIELYKKALKIEPNFPEAEYQCGTAYLALHQNTEAENAFRQAVELRPEWTLALSSLGSLLIQNSKFPEAERIIAKALELEPLNPPSLVAMTDLRLKTKASTAVLTDLLAKLTTLTSKANPTAATWSARAALESALGKRDDAKSSLANALKVDPKNRNALFQLADIALEEGDLIAAKEIVKTIRSISPNADSLKPLNAKIAAAEGDSASNPAELEKLLENDPKNPVVLGRLCSAYRIPDPQKALDFCRRASEAEPTNVNHAVGFGAALVQAKKFDAAFSVLRKIIEIVPENSTAHANLATALFESKRYAEAKAEYTWLTAKQPNLAVAYFFLAICHDNLGEFPDAMANYQQFLRIADPTTSKLEIEKVNLRLPALEKKIKKK